MKTQATPKKQKPQSFNRLAWLDAQQGPVIEVLDWRAVNK